MTGMECSRVYDLAPELALGLLDGAERAEALAHLERCAKCHADVASLTELGEQLLLLAPGGPPPAGFETRVLDQLERQRWIAFPPDDVSPGPSGSSGSPGGSGSSRSTVTSLARRRPRFRRLPKALAAAAAVLVLGVGSAVVLEARAGDDGGRDDVAEPPAPPSEVVASVPMINRLGDAIGTVELLDTAPTTVRIDLAEWMEAIEDWPDPPQGPWRMEVFDEAGHRETYDLPLPEDDPTPDVTLAGDLGPVHHVSILDGAGTIWCTGRFT